MVPVQLAAMTVQMDEDAFETCCWALLCMAS